MACGCSDARSVVRIKDDTAAGRVALPESVAERCAYSLSCAVFYEAPQSRLLASVLPLADEKEEHKQQLASGPVMTGRRAAIIIIITPPLRRLAPNPSATTHGVVGADRF